MKKVLFLILASFLALSACGNSEETKSSDKKETKSSDKNSKKDDKNSDDKSNEEVSTQDETTEQQSTDEPSQSQETKQENKQVQLSNITDRSTLETVIYGNYSEQQKIQAYNSAVTNGVIPQGNVMEGPASAAYESSLKVESGEVESVYNKSSDNQIQNSNKSEADSENPYMNLPNQEWRANTGDGLSSGEKQTKQQILDGTFEGDDGDQILEALDYYQSKYGY
ncbi:hypothetical protein BU062_13595 [Staphylococcus succinus]|uniref:hypothetical protein n=1 Tax=Staphylococcus succinus TaxID=61015 RepID=UPI000D1E448E|nr:hypothetical protein [Staphylococcus succinus]PTI37193.1 hypothetical protein BU062_13595 [Staphylococcus succinus]